MLRKETNDSTISSIWERARRSFINNTSNISLEAWSLNFSDLRLELSFRRHKLRTDLRLFRNLYVFYAAMNLIFITLTLYMEYQVRMCGDSCQVDHVDAIVKGSKMSDINMKRSLSLCNATDIYSGEPMVGAFWCTQIEPMHPTTFFISRSFLMVSWSVLYLLSRSKFAQSCSTILQSNRWQWCAFVLTTSSTMLHTQAFFVNYGIFDAVSRDSSPSLMIPSGIEFVINIIFMVFFSSLRHVYATIALILTTAHFSFLTMNKMNISIWLILNMFLIVLLLSCFIRFNEVHTRRGFLNRLRLRRNNLRTSLRIRPFSVSNLRKWITGAAGENVLSSNRMPLLLSDEENEEESTSTNDLTTLLNQGDDASDDWIVDWKDLELRERIGEGSSGEVWRGLYRDQVVAVKKSRGVYSSDDILAELSAEASALFALKAHPHVVKLYGIALGTVTTGSVAIVLEWCSSNVKEMLREHPISLATRVGYTYLLTHSLTHTFT
jgi:hypothetical protein